eukprot:g7283.t1
MASIANNVPDDERKGEDANDIVTLSHLYSQTLQISRSNATRLINNHQILRTLGNNGILLVQDIVNIMKEENEEEARKREANYLVRGQFARKDTYTFYLKYERMYQDALIASNIQATGKKGKITKKDILCAINNHHNNNAVADNNNNEINIVDQSFIDILPFGGAGRDIVFAILEMLDMKSLSSLIYSSFIQLFCKDRHDFTLDELCKRIQNPYKIKFVQKLKSKLYRDTTHSESWGDAYLSYVFDMDRVEDFGEMVKHFRLLNLDINAQHPSDGTTIVHKLIRIYGICGEHGGIHVGESILKLPNIDLNIKNKNGNTPLLDFYLAGVDNDDKCVVALKQNGGETGLPPLLEASCLNNLDEVKKLLKKDDIDVNQTDEMSRTALHFASYMGHTEIVKHLLLTDDIDVNLQCTSPFQKRNFYEEECGLTPINIAAFYSRYKICELLLSHPKLDSINKTDEIHGRTVLHYAVIGGCEKLVRLLLNYPNIDLRIVDRRKGRKPWKYAWGMGRTTLMELLEKRGGGKSSEEEWTSDNDDDDSDSSQ